MQLLVYDTFERYLLDKMSSVPAYGFNLSPFNTAEARAVLAVDLQNYCQSKSCSEQTARGKE